MKPASQQNVKSVQFIWEGQLNSKTKMEFSLYGFVVVTEQKWVKLNILVKILSYL